MHLHLIEPRADGHRMQFVRRLVEQAPDHWQLSLSTFPSSLRHAGTGAALKAAGGRLGIVEIKGEAAFESGALGRDGFRLQPAYWRLFRRHWRSLSSSDRGDLVVVPYLDYCSYAIGMLGSPFGASRFAGIVMRPDFQFAEQRVVAPAPRHVGLKRWLFLRLLRHPLLHRLVSIDPSLRDWVQLHRPSGHDKLRYADDPSDMLGEGNKDAGRRHFGLRDDAFVILLFGGIDLRKGLADLLSLALSPGFPANGQVLVVGRQSDEARALIDKHRAQLPPHRFVCADRYVERGEEWLAFAAADCGWIAYDNFYGSSGVLSQCEQAGIPMLHRGEGIIGYLLSSRHEIDWPWLAGTGLRAAWPAPPPVSPRLLGQAFELAEPAGAQ